MNVKHIAGKTAGKVMLYTLSTCVWCKKTKSLLNELGIGYDYTDVDLLSEEEKGIALESIKKHNPECTFPTLVINDNRCIVGFKEHDIREAMRQ